MNNQIENAFVSQIGDMIDYDKPVQVTDLMIEINKLSTVRSKIIYLHKQGLKTAQISKMLGKRYQHVRNELINANLR